MTSPGSRSMTPCTVARKYAAPAPQRWAFPLAMVKLRTLPEALETPAGRRHTIDVIADAAHLGRTATETAAALGIKRDTVYATCRRYDELITRQEAS